MANFDPAFEIMIQNEGGYRLVNVHGDHGGQTYAGIARNSHPNWAGWRYIDTGDMQHPELSTLVRDFYKSQFWDKIAGEKINSQKVAEAIFDFGVNAGVTTAAKLVQRVVGSAQDGSIGPITIGKLNSMEESQFIARYAIAKIARYAEICNKDRSQSKFLLGWINRTIKGLA
ncbi:MAG: hypothetical protein OEV89_03720 [Desulfobulbaceae bacterium]|nr:hypothetical protein [Desulfobulbaceae bacterium]HIJ89852.1 N-acetylmuramidase [Deltaproteobacteria bacterium]